MKSRGLYKKSLFYFLTALFLLLAFYAIEFSIRQYYSDQNIKDHFQKNLLLQQKILSDKAGAVEDILNSAHNNHWPELERLLDPDHIYAQIFVHDSLLFWNSNKLSNDLDYLQGGSLDTIIHEKTAWYLVHFEAAGDNRIFLFKLILSSYPFDNKFLPSEANKEFLLSNDVRLQKNTADAPYVILNNEGQPFIGLTIEHNNDISQTAVFILFGVFLLFYI